MATAADKERLDTIRSRHNEASTDWMLVAGRTEQISARLIPGVPQVPVIALTEECGYQDRDFLLNAHQDIRFLLALLAEAFRTIRSLQQNDQPQKSPDYAAECSMKCGEPAFKRFLFEQHQVDIADHERVVTRVRTMLKIKSRADLNKDPEAAQRWASLRSEFEAWRRSP